MKKIVKAEVNSFVKGFISEASPLNFPDKATIDELNFDLNIDGTRDRRLGFDIETGGSFLASLGSPIASKELVTISTYNWEVDNPGTIKTVLVVKCGAYLHFYNSDANPISTSFINSLYIDSTVETKELSFTTIEGRLVFTNGGSGVYTVTFDGYTSFVLTYIPIKVRDVWGLEEKVYPLYESTKYRGTTISEEHIYNLNNQSWAVSRKNSAGTLVVPRTQYFTDLALYPSNGEAIWTGLQFQPVTAGSTFERMYTNLYTELLESGAVAAKGYYILSLGALGTSRVIEYCKTENISSPPAVAVVDAAIGRPVWSGGVNCIASYAGRLWYGNFDGYDIGADARSPDLRNMICFSQVVKNILDISKCYQEGDPTSRDASDLVDTDGGFIKIPDMGETKAMVNAGQALLVLTTNGVWAIQGGAEYGFTATNYKVSKISSFGCTSSKSVVIENENVYYWGDSGINLIAKNSLGDWSVNSITQASIQTFYSSIPEASRSKAVGVFDKYSKKIRWLYKENGRFNSNSKTWELLLDINLQAFTKNYIPPTAAHDFSIESSFTNSLKRIDARNDDSIKYLIFKDTSPNSSISFGEYNSTTFSDWGVASGVAGIDAKAYMLTGQQTAGDSSVDKQIPYLTMHFRRTEVGVDPSTLVPLKRSSCLMRCRWGFSNTIASGKWSESRQMYRYPRAQYVVDSSDTYDNGFELITTKNKIRGDGKAFSFYMETEPLLDCRILGWSISLSGNTNA